jgi:hypothetical protein
MTMFSRSFETTLLEILSSVEWMSRAKLKEEIDKRGPPIEPYILSFHLDDLTTKDIIESTYVQPGNIPSYRLKQVVHALGETKH